MYIYILLLLFLNFCFKITLVTSVGGDKWPNLMIDLFKIADSYSDESNESCYKSLNWFTRNTESFIYKRVT